MYMCLIEIAHSVM